MHGLFLVIGLFSCAAVGLVTVYLVTAGIPAIAEIGWKDFFLNTHWASTAQAPSFGIGAFLLTSVWGFFGPLCSACRWESSVPFIWPSWLRRR